MASDNSTGDATSDELIFSNPSLGRKFRSGLFLQTASLKYYPNFTTLANMSLFLAFYGENYPNYLNIAF